jgi:uncharacterized protein YdeI (YjbR/CyaY-like superfamily)
LTIDSHRPRYFQNQAKLRRWFQAHHASKKELWLGFHKVHTGRPSVTYRQALDEALCFGWIDGVRRGLGDEAWSIRFIPRVRKDNWSLVNIRRAKELILAGHMSPPGLRAFEHRNEDKAGAAHHGRRDAQLDASSERALRTDAGAWAFWSAQPPSYQKPAAWWILTAKKPETKARRLAQLLADSARGRRLRMLTPPSKR